MSKSQCKSLHLNYVQSLIQKTQINLYILFSRWRYLKHLCTLIWIYWIIMINVIQSLQFFATWFHSNAVMLACIHGWQNATLKHLHLIPFNNILNQVACKMIPRGLAINWEEKLGLQRYEDAFSQNQFRSISTSLQLLWPRLWNQWEAAW